MDGTAITSILARIHAKDQRSEWVESGVMRKNRDRGEEVKRANVRDRVLEMETTTIEQVENTIIVR